MKKLVLILSAMFLIGFADAQTELKDYKNVSSVEEVHQYLKATFKNVEIVSGEEFKKR